jgi:hypothetical protein
MLNVRYIERFSSTLWKQKEEYIYVDAALSYTGPPKLTFSGTGHLEGKEVVGTIDGVALTPMEVVSGTITLDSSYESSEEEITVHTGLPYTAIATTSRLNPKSAIGSAFGRRQVILDVTILVDNTVELEIGPDEDNTEPFKSFEVEDTLLYTGPIARSFPTGYDDELFVTCLSEKPTPVTILNVGTVVKTSDT